MSNCIQSVGTCKARNCKIPKEIPLWPLENGPKYLKGKQGSASGIEQSLVTPLSYKEFGFDEWEVGCYHSYKLMFEQLKSFGSLGIVICPLLSCQSLCRYPHVIIQNSNISSDLTFFCRDDEVWFALKSCFKELVVFSSHGNYSGLSWLWLGFLP